MLTSVKYFQRAEICRFTQWPKRSLCLTCHPPQAKVRAGYELKYGGPALTHYVLKTEGEAIENNQPAHSRERKNIYMQRFTPADWRMKCRKASNTSSKSVNSTRLHSANHMNTDAGFHTVRELWMNVERGQQVQRNHTMGDTQRK